MNIKCTLLFLIVSLDKYVHILFWKKNLIIKYIIFGSKCPAVVDMMLGESNNHPLFYKSAIFFLHFSCLIMTNALVIIYEEKCKKNEKVPAEKTLQNVWIIKFRNFFHEYFSVKL